MTLVQALAYFLREGWVGMVRSWKISLVAVATIAVSLLLTGTFLLVGRNLADRIADWRGQSRLLIYLEDDIEPADIGALRTRIAQASPVASVELVTTEQAHERFIEAFPSMADLLDGWTEAPLPASLEVTLARGAGNAGRDWLESLRTLPGVAHVDDDRDWLRQMEVAALAVRGFGLTIGAVLLLTSVFTIASVIRLTVYLYQDEIDVMRMVGATEFFIRGPFYFQGLLQGLLGGVLAHGALILGHGVAIGRWGDTVAGTLLARNFLGVGGQVSLIVLGGLAGLAGAIASLRREQLGSPPAELGT